MGDIRAGCSLFNRCQDVSGLSVLIALLLKMGGALLLVIFAPLKKQA